MTGPPHARGDAFAALVATIEAWTGLAFRGTRRRRMLRGVERAMTATRAASPTEYAALLQRDEEALNDLLARLTVGETFFFRERRQLDAAVQLAAAVARMRRRSVRAWSAGCASGEEAYTVAMLLAGMGAPAEVLGTDLCEAAVVKARAGVYGRWSLRGVDEQEQACYFEPVRGKLRVRDMFRDAVRFRRANLLDGPPAAARFDLVLCRNVLIYLTPDAVAQAGASLRDALTPDGYLLTGSADPLLDVEGLERRLEHGVMIYRRTQPSPGRAEAPDAGAGSSARAGRPGQDRGRQRLSVIEAVRPPAPPHAGGDARAQGGSRLGFGQDVGHERTTIVQPARRSAAAVGKPPRLPEGACRGPAVAGAAVRYRAAVDALDSGRLEDAKQEVRAALYLHPHLAVGHLLLGAIARLERRPSDARRSFRTAAELLRECSPDAAVPLADEPAGRLARVAASLADG